MIADFQMWLAVGPEARLARWRLLLEKSGWPATATDLDSLLGARAGAGLAVIDAAALGADPGPRLRSIRAKLASVSLLLTSAAPLPDSLLIAALEAGADDYLPESLDDRLILAKLSAHLRRVLPRISGLLDVLTAPGGGLRLERANRSVSVKARGGQWRPLASLTATEAELLSLFLRHSGSVLERRFLLESVWQAEAAAIQPGTVDKHVESLRRKLQGQGGRIRTVYGSGYIFEGADS